MLLLFYVSMTVLGVCAIRYWSSQRVSARGVRLESMRLTPGGVSLQLRESQNAYTPRLNWRYRISDGALSADLKVMLVRDGIVQWVNRIQVNEVDGTRGFSVQRELDLGTFRVSHDGWYVLQVRPSTELDPRIRLDSIDLFGGVATQQPITLGVASLLLGVGLLGSFATVVPWI